MSFCVSHRGALDKDLKHLYSGLPRPLVMRSSDSVLGGSLDLMDRVMERHKRPPERFEAKFQEYLPQYGARLPRAPAFRHVSPEQAREISERLSRPTVMSAIRRQSAVSRGAAERAESRRCGSRATARAINSERDESTRKKTEPEPADGNSCRKISYQDWSDEESAVYYYEDEESSVIESTNEKRESKIVARTVRYHDTENHVIDFGPTASQVRGGDKNRSNEKTPNSVDKSGEKSGEGRQVSEVLSEAKRRGGRSGSSGGDSDSSLSSGDTGGWSQAGQGEAGERNTEASTMTTSSTTEERAHEPNKAQQTKANLSRKKISLLEQIMQARSPQQRGKHASSRPSGSTVFSETRAGNFKRLQRREPLDTRLRQSPYCEPMPQLFIVYTPVAHRKCYYGNQRGRSSDTWTMRKDQATPGVSSAAAKRPRTRQSTRTSQHSLSASKTPRSPDMARSRSAPARPAARTKKFPVDTDDKEKFSYHQRMPESRGQQTFPRLKSSDPGLSETLPAARKGPATVTGHSTDAKRSDHRPDPHLWYEYEEIRYRRGNQEVTEDGHSCRFASPEAMSRVNKRLQKPTKVKMIRDRMRWAPNNDRDLADPVRVIREITEGHEEVNWKRRKGDDVRGESVAHDQSGSEDSIDEDDSARFEREKQETLAQKAKLRQKNLKNKKDAWVRKGVIQPRKNLTTTQPHIRSKGQTQSLSRQLDTHPRRSGPKPTPGRVQQKETSVREAACRSFPRPHPTRSRSPSPTSRSRTSSQGTSTSSEGTVESRSTVKNGSLSRSRSRSSSHSSRSRSRSRSKSISSSRSRSKSSSRSRSNSESKPNSASLKQTQALHTNTALKDTESHRERNFSQEDSITDEFSIEKNDGRHTSGKLLENSSGSSTVGNSSPLQRPGDEEVKGRFREFQETERAMTKTAEVGGSNSAGSSVGVEAREGRGGEYVDGFGRGHEEDTSGQGSMPVQSELESDITWYNQSRPTRGSSKESFTREDGDGDGVRDNTRESFCSDKSSPVMYSVRDGMDPTTH